MSTLCGYIATQRNRPLFQDDEGFLYTYHSAGKVGEIWRCKRRDLHCLARLHVKDGRVLKRSHLGHNHTPHESRGSKNRPPPIGAALAAILRPGSADVGKSPVSAREMGESSGSVDPLQAYFQQSLQQQQLRQSPLNVVDDDDDDRAESGKGSLAMESGKGREGAGSPEGGARGSPLGRGEGREGADWCEAPSQCAAFHQLTTAVTEINSKMNAMMNLLQTFFSSWKISQAGGQGGQGGVGSPGPNAAGAQLNGNGLGGLLGHGNGAETRKSSFKMSKIFPAMPGPPTVSVGMTTPPVNVNLLQAAQLQQHHLFQLQQQAAAQAAASTSGPSVNKRKRGNAPVRLPPQHEQLSPRTGYARHSEGQVPRFSLLSRKRGNAPVRLPPQHEQLSPRTGYARHSEGQAVGGESGSVKAESMGRACSEEAVTTSTSPSSPPSNGGSSGKKSPVTDKRFRSTPPRGRVDGNGTGGPRRARNGRDTGQSDSGRCGHLGPGARSSSRSPLHGRSSRTVVPQFGGRATDGTRDKVITAGAAIWGQGLDPHLDRLYMEEVLERVENEKFPYAND